MFYYCVFLAKAIDNAVIYNEVPSPVTDMPLVIKQVYQHKTDAALQSAIMLLMISIKNACKSGWFQAVDTNELLALANEISTSFSGATIAVVEPSNALSIVSTIISRFYPRIRMGQILASFEAKPGYHILAYDFLISMRLPQAAVDERVRLFVIQTDNMETSSCIVTPPEVNFMLNGKGVEKRNSISMDGGPQLPTDVNAMLKYGTNLIQIVGKFNGNYVISIAYTNMDSSYDTKPLEDYVLHAASESLSDAEIIEGPSRISLNCPISFKRIHTPVKGRLCKHHQCFDYENFLEINSRKPSWRCPHCNQSVCFTELRIDQNMVKILKDANEDVTDVLVSADGSWKVVERDGFDQQQNGSTASKQNVSGQLESKGLQNAVDNVIDLIMDGGDDCDIAISSAGSDGFIYSMNQRHVNHTNEFEDRKVFQDPNLPCTIGNASVESISSGTSDIAQEPLAPAWQNVWSRISLWASSVNGSSSYSGFNAASRIDPVGNSLIPVDAIPAAVVTDAVSPALTREPVDGHGAAQLTTAVQNVPQLRQLVVPENLHLQQPQFDNSIVSNETSRRAVPRQVNRAPVAIQALPAQAVPNLHNQRLRPSMMASSSSMISNSSPAVASHVSTLPLNTLDGFGMLNGEIERQQLSMSQVGPFSAPDFASASQFHTPQTWDRQITQNQLLQQAAGLPQTVQAGTRLMPFDNQRANAYRTSIGLFPSRHQRPPHLRGSQTISNADRANSLLTGNPPQNYIHPSLSQHSSPQTARQPGITALPVQGSRPTPSFPTNPVTPLGEQRWHPTGDNSTEFPTDENWRRSVGRMRGSLTGQSYSAALSQLMAQPIIPAPVRASSLPRLNAYTQPNAHGQAHGHARPGGM